MPPIAKKGTSKIIKNGRYGKSKEPITVETAIDKINLKIDDLNKNLANFSTGVQDIVNEIPRDIRSINSVKNSSQTG